MKKLLLSFSLVAGLFFTVAAQKEGAVNKISLGADFLYPIAGIFADSYNLGFGGSIMGEYNVLEKLNITAVAGYTTLTYKQEIKDLYAGYDLKSDAYYPVKLGAKYYFGKFYGAGDAGMAISIENDRNSAFAFSGGVGASFSVSAKSSIDVGVRYEGWSFYNTINDVTTTNMSSFIGLRAAYAFGF